MQNTTSEMINPLLDPDQCPKKQESMTCKVLGIANGQSELFVKGKDSRGKVSTTFLISGKGLVTPKEGFRGTFEPLCLEVVKECASLGLRDFVTESGIKVIEATQRQFKEEGYGGRGARCLNNWRLVQKTQVEVESYNNPKGLIFYCDPQHLGEDAWCIASSNTVSYPLLLVVFNYRFENINEKNEKQFHFAVGVNGTCYEFCNEAPVFDTTYDQLYVTALRERGMLLKKE